MRKDAPSSSTKRPSDLTTSAAVRGAGLFGVLGLLLLTAACGSEPRTPAEEAEMRAEDLVDDAEDRADRLEDQADELEQEADEIRRQARREADAVEAEAERLAVGGATAE